MVEMPYQDIIKALVDENGINKINPEEVKVSGKIGKGSQSTVWLAEYKGIKVAKKTLTEFDIKCIIHEIAILSRLDHKNIPKFIGIILEENLQIQSKDKKDTNANIPPYISYVSTYIKGKPLDEIDLSAIAFSDKVKMIKQISDLITFVHANNCVHRDIKAENIMVDNDLNTYLIDFGISKVLGDTNQALTRAKGTVHYLPPEIFNISNVGEGGQIISVVTPAVDVWAFGCLISYIFSGIVPWGNVINTNGSNKPEIQIQRALVKKKDFPIPKNVTDEKIKEIIRLGTNNEATKRITMEELNQYIQKL